MFAHPPPNSTEPLARRPKRVYIACVHCRRRKVKCITSQESQPCARCIKKGLKCDYLSVPEQQARSASTTHGQEASDQNPLPPTPYMASTRNNTPQSYEGNPLPSGHLYRPPQNDSQFNSVNYLGAHSQLAHDPRVYATVDSSPQQPIEPGHRSTHERYFANFSLNSALGMYSAQALHLRVRRAMLLWKRWVNGGHPQTLLHFAI
ncbi:hypothetical protein FB451DRAFT_1183938 [Mycena latifolia]|nr:hypothetical protein FB451DRAFT_1183938 [Mycena latifolia]